MRKPLLLVASLVALLGLALSGCGSVRPYAANVSLGPDHTRIKTSDLDGELNAIRANKEYLDAIKQQAESQGGKIEGAGKGTFDASFVAQILNRRILIALARASVAQNKLKVTDADRKAARTSLEQSFGKPLFSKFTAAYQAELEDSSATVNVLSAWVEKRGNKAAVKKFYDAHAKEFAETCLRHIVVADKATAEALRARIVAGEKFADIAAASSTDKGSGVKGGDLGCVTLAEAASLTQPFRVVALKLKVNELSQPVQTSFGWHLIEVTKKQQRPLDAQLEQTIGSQLTDLTTFVQDLITKAKISVNPRYGHFEKKEFRGVVPPDAPAVSTTTTLPQLPGSGGLGGPTDTAPTDTAPTNTAPPDTSASPSTSTP